MINATIMENVNKRNIILLISSVFILAANCLAERPIANYCLYVNKEEGGYLKFESIIDSSVFEKMEERNIWQCEPNCETHKRYFIKIGNRDNMTCLTSESIYREYNFLIKNINLRAFGDSWEGHDKYGFSGCIDCPSEGKPLGSSSVVYTLNATTELVIDFPDRNFTSVKDTSKLNEIKSSFGEPIPVSWKFKIRCPPHSDTTITGKYFIRITGECK